MLEILALVGVAVLAVLIAVFLPAIGFAFFFLMYIWDNPVVQNLVYTASDHKDLTGFGTAASVFSIMLFIAACGLNILYLKEVTKN